MLSKSIDDKTEAASSAKGRSPRWPLFGKGFRILFLAMASGIVASLGTPRANAAPDGIVLVQDGKPLAEIVLAAKPSRSASFAAKELQYHLKKLTGTEVPIVGEAAAAASGRPRILVGESPETIAGGFRNSDFKKQEYLIHFQPDGIILMGRDREDSRPVDYANPATFPDLYDAQGTCYAVYDFLERYCGVRWYLPTDLGIVAPKSNSLVVQGKEIRRSPVVKRRNQSLNYQIPADLCGDTVSDQPIPALAWREQILWYLRNRLGGEFHSSTHSLYGYYDRFWAKNPKNEAAFEGAHPDWFAKGYPEDTRPSQMCYANAGLVRQIARDACDYFDGKGKKPGAVAGEDFFTVAVMDGGGMWCHGEECRALLKKSAERGKGLFSNDLASNYVFGFVNAVASEVFKTHPDKWISTLAYSDYAYPPENEKLSPNLDVTLCLHARNVYNLAVQENDDAILKSWVKAGPSISKNVWLYYCFPSLKAVQQKFRCFPGFFAHTVAKKIPQYVSEGVRGIYYEPSYLANSRRSVLLDQLEFYLTWKLADDPSLDGNKLIDEFFDLYYGGAAKPMREFYERVEQIFADPSNYASDAGHQTEKMAWGSLGTKERMEELGKWMAEAKAAARTSPEKERVALFDKGIWQYMLKGQSAYETREAAANASKRITRVPKILPPFFPDQWSKLDWNKGSQMTSWFTRQGGATSRQIEGRVAHDGRYLYLRLEERGATDGLISRDGLIWNEDFWEIILSNQKEKPGFSIGINARGITKVSTANGQETSNLSGVKVVSEVASSGDWKVCLAVPLEPLASGGDIDKSPIYLNVLRASASRNATVWVPAPAGTLNPEPMGELDLAR